jgi:hypothetical protein
VEGYISLIYILGGGLVWEKLT